MTASKRYLTIDFVEQLKNFPPDGPCPCGSGERLIECCMVQKILVTPESDTEMRLVEVRPWRELTYRRYVS